MNASSQAFCIGDTAVLNAPLGFASYQWYDQNGIIEGAITSSYEVSVSGSFHVVVSDSEGCTISSESMEMSTIEIDAVSTLEVNNVLSTSVGLE